MSENNISGPVIEPVIIRVFSDADGETHFDEIRLPGESRQSAVSTAIAWISESVPVRGMVWRRVEKDHPTTTPHVTPTRQLMVLLSGTAEIEVSSGERRRVAPGQILLGEDLTGKGHITRAVDHTPRVTLILELGDGPIPSA
jgi:hypothetical protein